MWESDCGQLSGDTSLTTDSSLFRKPTALRSGAGATQGPLQGQEESVVAERLGRDNPSGLG